MKQVPVYFILIFAFLSCNDSKNLHAKFIKRVINIHSDTTVQTCSYYRNKYICLTTLDKFICLNNTYSVDSILTNRLNANNNIRFFYISEQDSLIGYSVDKDYNHIYYFLDSTFRWKKIDYFPKPPSVYEDENFTFNSCCFGEFGGALFINDKHTNKTYSSPATCVLTVDSLNGSYYITSTLAHGRGWTTILKIDSPKEMYELKVDSLKHFCQWWQNLSPGENIVKGVQNLVDTDGIMTLTAFRYESELFFICSDTSNKAFVGQIRDSSFVLIDSIFDKSLWSYYPYVQKFGKKQLSNFCTYETSGFLEINADTITIITFDK